MGSQRIPILTPIWAFCKVSRNFEFWFKDPFMGKIQILTSKFNMCWFLRFYHFRCGNILGFAGSVVLSPKSSSLNRKQNRPTFASLVRKLFKLLQFWHHNELFAGYMKDSHYLRTLFGKNPNFDVQIQHVLFFAFCHFRYGKILGFAGSGNFCLSPKSLSLTRKQNRPSLLRGSGSFSDHFK